jgi:perosamine synthetase
MRKRLTGETMGRIPVAGPWITRKEVSYVTDAVKSAWYEKANVYHQRFEKAFADYVGKKYAIALPSCTSAIHLSLLALGVKAKDEVIVPDITWIATAAPISYVGAKPVFADIDERTWCLSAPSFEKMIGKKTKAVIPVDLYGNMPDMEAIRSIAGKAGIAVIEDAAEAMGAQYRKGKAGSFGDTGVFSFHGSKTMTAGEGGMLVTDRKEVYLRCLFLRDHGRKPGNKKFFNSEIAYKYKMSAMQAALGLAQLERIDELLERKRRIFDWYVQELSDLPDIELNYEAPGTRSVYWMVTVIIGKKYRIAKESLVDLMSRKNIDCRPFFYPLSSLPAYKDLRQARTAKKTNPVSYSISAFGINLPSGLNLTRKEIKYVCAALRSVLKI